MLQMTLVCTHGHTHVRMRTRRDVPTQRTAVARQQDRRRGDGGSGIGTALKHAVRVAHGVCVDVRVRACFVRACLSVRTQVCCARACLDIPSASPATR